MLCLSDNDLILKLAEYDLLGHALEVLRTKRSEVLILPRAKAVISKKIGPNHTRDGIDRAVRFVTGLAVLDRVDKDEVGALLAVRHVDRGITYKVDVGEATLFAATKYLPHFLVATGDKKCLRALHEGRSVCPHVTQRLRGNVVCFEQVIVRIIDTHGYKLVKERVGSCVGDEAMTHAFAGGRVGHPEIACRKWLGDYVEALRSQTGDLLVIA